MPNKKLYIYVYIYHKILTLLKCTYQGHVQPAPLYFQNSFIALNRNSAPTKFPITLPR